MSDKTEAERRALPWYDPEAIPRAESDATHCRHPDCRETNWGGRDRIHTRGEGCPPLPTAADQPTTEPSEVETAESDVRKAVDRAVGEVLFNVSNDPRKAQGLLLGVDTGPLREKVVDAVLAVLAPAPQPAADTEIQVQWGVRYRTGRVKELSSESAARDHAKAVAAVGFTDPTVVKQRRTPWEEA